MLWLIGGKDIAKMTPAKNNYHAAFRLQNGSNIAEIILIKTLFPLQYSLLRVVT